MSFVGLTSDLISKMLEGTSMPTLRSQRSGVVVVPAGVPVEVSVDNGVWTYLVVVVSDDPVIVTVDSVD